MKKLAVIAAIVLLCASLGASRAAAQGPAGAGAGAPTTASAKSESSHKHSLNPVKWIKKDSKPASDQADVDAERNKKLGAKLQAQGVLPANTELKDACATFKELSNCVAGLHASHNLDIGWNCLKWDLTGVPTGADMSVCKGPESDKAWSLEKAIHAVKPDADAKAEAKGAEKQAQADLKEVGS